MKGNDWLDFEAYSAHRQASRELERKRQLRDQEIADGIRVDDTGYEEFEDKTLDLVVTARNRRLALARRKSRDWRSRRR